MRWGGVAEAVLRLLSVCTGGEWGFSKGGGGGSGFGTEPTCLPHLVTGESS